MKAINRWISAKSAGLSIGKRGEFDNPPFDFAPTSSPFVEHIIDLLRAPPPSSSSSFLFLSSRGLWTMVIFSWNKCSPLEVKTLIEEGCLFDPRSYGNYWNDMKFASRGIEKEFWFAESFFLRLDRYL